MTDTPLDLSKRLSGFSEYERLRWQYLWVRLPIDFGQLREHLHVWREREKDRADGRLVPQYNFYPILT